LPILKAKCWVVAVTKRLNGDGFLITAYQTDAIKEGVVRIEILQASKRINNPQAIEYMISQSVKEKIKV